MSEFPSILHPLKLRWNQRLGDFSIDNWSTQQIMRYNETEVAWEAVNPWLCQFYANMVSMLCQHGTGLVRVRVPLLLPFTQHTPQDSYLPDCLCVSIVGTKTKALSVTTDGKLQSPSAPIQSKPPREFSPWTLGSARTKLRLVMHDTPRYEWGRSADVSMLNASCKRKLSHSTSGRACSVVVSPTRKPHSFTRFITLPFSFPSSRSAKQSLTHS